MRLRSGQIQSALVLAALHDFRAHPVSHTFLRGELQLKWKNVADHDVLNVARSQDECGQKPDSALRHHEGGWVS